MTKKKLNVAITRIKRMEKIFDTLQAGVQANPPVIDGQLLEILVDYYANGLWIEDYALDESGYLPSDLKRGVLSQDGVYDFLYVIGQCKSALLGVTDGSSEAEL